MKIFSRNFLALIILVSIQLSAQPNPYNTVEGVWGKLPKGRTWGSTSAVFPATDGSGNIWVAERCGTNSCAGRDDAPILLFNQSGELLKSFGENIFVWPHGIHVDSNNNVWITDARGENGIGHQVHKFSPEGILSVSYTHLTLPTIYSV